MIRTATRLILGLTAMALAMLPGSPGAAEQNYLDSVELLQLLERRDFGELEGRLFQAQMRYENGDESDIVVMLAFDALANSDPAHEDRLNAWVDSMPDSFVPLAVRGMYYSDLGWAARGSAYARSTSKEQFAAMRGYHEHAIADLKRAIELNPRFIVGYAELINLSKASSRDALHHDALERALEIDPRSYAVRKAHLLSLMPRWGGSYEEIDAFIENTRGYADENPDLKPLLGFADYVRARNFSDQSNHRYAVTHYTKALEHRDKAWYYKARGVAHYRLKDYDSAIADLTRAIELWPQYPEALAWRGRVYERLERYDEALEDLLLSTRLRPYAYFGQRRLGNVLGKKGRYDEAVEAYSAALHYHPNSGALWRKKAYYLAFKLDRMEDGAQAYQIAAQQRPHRPVYWYDYGYVLYKLHDCEVVPVLRTFLRACRDSNDKRCDDRHKRWAKRVVTQSVEQFSCADKAAYPTGRKSTRRASRRPDRDRERDRDMSVWELYKLYVRGVIWAVLEWLNLPQP